MGMNATMFRRMVMVVAPTAASPSRPTICTKTWKTSTSRKTCAPAGPPYFISRPKSSRSGRQPRRVLNSSRNSRRSRSPTATSAEVHEPATVAHPAPAIPISGNPSRPKIRTRARAMFTAVPATSIASTVQVRPRPEKNPLTAVMTSIGRAAKQRQRRYVDSSTCKAGVCPPRAIR